MQPTPAVTMNGFDVDSGVTGRSSGPMPESDTAAQALITASTPHQRSRRRRITHSADAGAEPKSDDAATKKDATARPTGVAITKPAFFPATITPGVASACSARKPALVRKASETRYTRGSFRCRAASPV